MSVFQNAQQAQVHSGTMSTLFNLPFHNFTPHERSYNLDHIDKTKDIITFAPNWSLHSQSTQVLSNKSSTNRAASLLRSVLRQLSLRPSLALRTPLPSWLLSSVAGRILYVVAVYRFCPTYVVDAVSRNSNQSRMCQGEADLGL